ncbi:hypothetical protein AC578_2505 [Pseudocercospora eumusae]|uniref:Macro domain-containing protein n=1 Tax=Pseudocercospora eumusae TaxID=321146 RepID=A0A139HXQ5_9PEZI|nr:hypothetical protein AC578_2505 [Pseudocercospora eumusae]
MSTIPLDQIPTLTLLYKLKKLQASSDPVDANATSRFNDKISLIRNDITKLEVDAIVNAANESLLGGGGVDGAIHRAAGPELVEECETLDGCDTGSAKITGAYELPCKKVIHAVGPVYWKTKKQGKHTSLLQGCYTTSLDLAASNNCKSIAFSALSTGVYGYPSDEAAETAIQAVKRWLETDEARADKIERVIFCQFMQKDVDAYDEYIPKYFPPSETAAEEVDESAKESGEAETTSAEGKATEKDESLIPDLPDVPTKEPKQPDEPEPKKQKLDETAKV